MSWTDYIDVGAGIVGAGVGAGVGGYFFGMPGKGALWGAGAGTLIGTYIEDLITDNGEDKYKISDFLNNWGGETLEGIGGIVNTGIETIMPIIMSLIMGLMPIILIGLILMIIIRKVGK